MPGLRKCPYHLMNIQILRNTHKILWIQERSADILFILRLRCPSLVRRPRPGHLVGKGQALNGHLAHSQGQIMDVLWQVLITAESHLVAGVKVGHSGR